MIVYSIKNTKDNTFFTNGGFRKEFGNLYKTRGAANFQVTQGKINIGIRFGSINPSDIKIVEFELNEI